MCRQTNDMLCLISFWMSSPQVSKQHHLIASGTGLAGQCFRRQLLCQQPSPIWLGLFVHPLAAERLKQDFFAYDVADWPQVGFISCQLAGA